MKPTNTFLQTPRLALTSGEPAGIGPDLAVQIAQRKRDYQLVVIGDAGLLQQRAKQLNLPLAIHHFDVEHEPCPDRPGELCVQHIAVSKPVTAGLLDKRNARYVLKLLDAAITGCKTGKFNAVVTGPVHKSIINEAGIAFTGHTEYLAEATRTPKVVMMLATPNLRVALATTHLPLQQVSAAITQGSLEQILRILNHGLIHNFGLKQPVVSICGLNPHAGEGGYLGREEIDTIEPCLQKLRNEGFDLRGPIPADTAFTPHSLKGIDAVLAMYHDQGLPVLKHQGFGKAVNITLGLPIVRTSVDHGTALDLAGTGQADNGSLNYALEVAQQIATHHGRAKS